MPDFLTPFFSSNLPTPAEVGLRLLLSLILGWIVAAIYRHTKPQGEIPASFPTTLILLAVLIAMVTQVIGDNVARAFSLVGALSIVRFRTVVRDTQDTAYVILAVVTGMAVGAHNIWVAVLGLFLVAVASAWCKWRFQPEAQPVFLLIVRFDLGLDATRLAQPLFEKHLLRHNLVSQGTANKGIAMEFIYEARLRQDVAPGAVVDAFMAITGLQSVQLRRRDFEAS